MRYESIVTLTPSEKSLVALLPTVLTTASVRSKPLSLTWTFHMCLSMPRLRLQFSPSTLKEPTSSLPMKPIPTPKVTRMLLKLIKKNPSRTLPIILKGIRLWRRRMRRLLPFSSSFFFFTCKLLTFDNCNHSFP